MKDSVKKNIRIAFCYDFDKTLTPSNMQEQGFIQDLGISCEEFWKLTDDYALENDMDLNLSYMKMMIELSKNKFNITRECLMEYGSKLRLFSGLDGWFERINNYAKKNDIEAEHYVISSGICEIIEGSSISKEFKKIYASSFCYDKNGNALWPKQLVNYTNKTQFIFRIEKGILDVNDNRVNAKMRDDEIYIPMTRMIYIGDSETDIPCMRIINSANGFSIGVYSNNKNNVLKMLRDNRICYYAKADYSKNSEMEKLCFAIIDKISSDDRLENIRLSLL